MRRRFIIVAAAAASLALIALLLLVATVSNHKLQLLRSRLATIQLAVERFAVDTEGAYPRSLDELQSRGYLTALPLNPYSGRPMRVLSVTDPPSAGDIVYVGWGPIIAVGPEGADTDPLLPTEIDEYLLAAYGPISRRQLSTFPNAVARWQASLGGVESGRYQALMQGQLVFFKGRRDEDYSVHVENLVPDISLFACRLTAGEDYASGTR